MRNRRRLATGLVQGGLRRFGYELRPLSSRRPRDYGDDDTALFESVAPYTMTTPESVKTLAEAVRHVASTGVPGVIVECGVWRGGSMMAAALTLLKLGRTDIDLYLFDTFDGMTEPTERDVAWTGESATAQLEHEPPSDDSHLWARAGMDVVRTAMESTGYPMARVHLVQGPVEETLPAQAPQQIALLRLDTDWYESSLHELLHLYPRLSPGGILILDDYGWWEGVREATDEYFAVAGDRPFLVRIDDGGVRLAVKPQAPAERAARSDSSE